METSPQGYNTNPRANTTSKKYKQQIEWRINKVRELLARGYSPFKISSELRVSQSTISRDIKTVRHNHRQGEGKNGIRTSEQHSDLSLAVEELIQNLWKIIDDTRTSSKLRIKAHSMMMQYHQIKAQLLAESSRLVKNEENYTDDAKVQNGPEINGESKRKVWTKRTIEKRLKYHTQIGFAADHFEMIDQIKSVQAILSRTMLDESSKVESDVNVIAICRLSSSILRNTEFLRELTLDDPVVE